MKEAPYGRVPYWGPVRHDGKTWGDYGHPKGMSLQKVSEVNCCVLLRRGQRTLTVTDTGNMLGQQFNAFLLKVQTYLKSRLGNLQFRIFKPREMPQNLAAYSHDKSHSLIQYRGHLTDKERESILRNK